MTDGIADTDKGYTKIAHELLEAIAASDFSKREFKLILTLIRKTYGFNKKEDDITLTQLANHTGIKLSHVSESVRALESKNVFLKREGRHGYLLKINKNYGTWHVPKTGTFPKQEHRVPKTGTQGSQNGNMGVPKTGTTIDNLTKDNPNRGSADESPLDRDWETCQVP